MKLKRKTKLNKRLISVLQKNDGASLVLVAIIAVIIVAGVVVLRISTSALLASADKQMNQDRAYMIAVSLGDSIDKAIKNDKISDPHILNGFDDSANLSNAIPDSEVKVRVEDHPSGMDVYTVITVSSRVADAEYEYKLTYIQSGSVYVRQY
jgi:hypothetical protein